MSRRTRWFLWIAAGALLAAALGYLISDQVQARDHYGQDHTALGVTRQQTHTVTAQLDEVRRDLNILETQVGSDSTALSQDSSQLLGAQTALAAAQAHVTQQASLITSLQTRLRDRSPPTLSYRSPAGEACRCKAVQRLTGVAYLALIRAGNSVMQGTSASGAAPTAVTGSVSSQT